MQEPDSSTDFDRAGEILADAINVPPPDRPALIAERCGDDSDLERSVVKMLSHFERLGSFLTKPPSSREAHTLSPGDLLADQFRILASIGAGGMGEVYRAEDLEAQDIIAIKTIRPEWSASADALDRFRAELRQARRIAHPNVCKLFDFRVGRSPSGGSLAFFTMQFLDGESLSERLGAGPIPTPETFGITKGIAAGLDAAHGEDIVHRDLKPANIILVRRRDGSERPVILDFGLSKDLTAVGTLDHTAETVIVGSPTYMAPEQFDSTAAVTRAADLYAFALIVWEMLTGSRPFKAKNMFQLGLQRSLKEPPLLSASLPGVPGAWDAVFAKALARDPAARFSSASAFLEALEPRNPSSLGHPLPSESKLSRFSRRSAIISGTSALFLSSAYLIYRLYKQANPIPDSPVLMLTSTKHDSDQTSTQFAAAADLWLKSQIQQSSHIRIVAPRRIESELDRMRAAGAPSPSVANARTAREIALREGARLILFSTMAKTGEDYTLHSVLELLDQSPTTPEDRWPFDIHFNEQEGASELASRVEHLANQLRQRMGELEKDYDVHRRPAAELTTANWDALQAYIAGDQAWRDRKRAEALRLLESATSFDPGFALAWGRLADLRMAVGQHDAGFDAYVKASVQVARKNLTDPESLRIRGIFALDREDYQEADKTFAEFREKYPDLPLPYFYGADCARILGQPAYSAHLLDQAIRLSPRDSVFLVQRALYALEEGDLDRASRQLNEAAAQGPNAFSPRVACGIALSRLDLAASDKALQSVADDSERSGLLACFDAERGRFSDAAHLLLESIASNAKESEEWFSQTLLLAGVQIAAGLASQATAICRDLCERAPGIRTLRAAAILARAGDPDRAAKVRRDTARALGERTQWPIYKRLTADVGGEIALARGRASEAVSVFQGASSPQDVNIWPEQRFRAAALAGRFDLARPLLRSLIENPGRWFVAATTSSPCFLRNSLVLARRLPELVTDSNKFRALCNALDITTEEKHT